jgi:hypothetical protein
MDNVQNCDIRKESRKTGGACCYCRALTVDAAAFISLKRNAIIGNALDVRPKFCMIT